jgi:hypothetical protein
VPLGNGPKLTAGTKLAPADALAVADGKLGVDPDDGSTDGEPDGSSPAVAVADGTGAGGTVGVGVSRSPLALKMMAATSSARMTRLMAASGLNVRGCR